MKELVGQDQATLSAAGQVWGCLCYTGWCPAAMSDHVQTREKGNTSEAQVCVVTAHTKNNH